MSESFLFNIIPDISQKITKNLFQEIFGEDGDSLYDFYLRHMVGNINGFYVNLPYINSARYQDKGYQDIFYQAYIKIIKEYFAENGYQLTKIPTTPPTPPPTHPVSISNTRVNGSRVRSK